MPFRRSPFRGALALAGLLAASVYFMVFLARSAGQPLPAFDTYAYFMPVMLQAVAAVRDGGRGLFWNAFQACGQPFVGSGTTGVWYPPFLFALLLDGDQALSAVIFFNVVVGALGMYFLCRELRLGVAASLAGALAFGFSNSVVDLATSTPIVAGPYAWMPLALLACERLLRAPTLRTAAALGVVLTLALLPGHPQVLVFIYQLLALRVAFEIVRVRRWIGWRTFWLFGLALVLPLFLGAGHLLPAMEVAGLSVRSGPLSIAEMQNLLVLTPGKVHDQFVLRRELFDPFLIVPMMIASAALCTRRLTGLMIFYGALCVVTADLGLGSEGLTFRLYSHLPVVSAFRAPDRFFWVLAFGAAMLTAIGTDALVTASDGNDRWRPYAAFGLPALLLALLKWWTPNVGTLAGEAAFIPLALAGAAITVWMPRWRGLGAAALVGALFANLLLFRPAPLRNLLPHAEATLRARAPTFEFLKARITPQDRIHVLGVHMDASLQHKTGALFGVPTLSDYDSLATFRYANFVTMLRTGAPMKSLNDFYFPYLGMLPPGSRRHLLNLAAVRYVVADQAVDTTFQAFPFSPLQQIAAFDDVRVYENPQALPRARWVSRMELVPNPETLLQRLATSRDLDRVVRLEAVPASGWTGGAWNGRPAPVTFTTNDPEHVVLQVDAPEHGFVVLADQWFPGWTATVDGRPTEILRADYLFRAVEVPPGPSTVEFRYFPARLCAGMALSALTLIALAMAVRRSERKTKDDG